MQKPELLSPAGNMDALKAAIHNGADAIYISGKNFGARKFADNFDNKSLIEAINYAHLYDVKIYVTTNTLIYENEDFQLYSSQAGGGRDLPGIHGDRRRCNASERWAGASGGAALYL